MPRVFLAHRPVHKNRATGEWELYLDLSPAKRFGTLCPLLPDRPPVDPAVAIPLLKEGLASITAQDYLLLVGSPTLITWTAVVAASLCPAVSVLDWDRTARHYNVLPLTLFHQPTAHHPTHQ